MEQLNIIVRVATSEDIIYANTITDEMANSAQVRGTGIARRTPDYVSQKMMQGKAVIALTPEKEWVGFCYIEAWEHDKFVANSGLIVAPAYRKTGVAKQIKYKIFALSRKMYPEAKIFGLTTGLAVMKINSELGYEPVTYSELTDDENFWAGCKSCVNYDILMSKGRKNCMCTAMLYHPKDHTKPQETAEEFNKNSKIYERFMRLKQKRLIKYLIKKKSEKEQTPGNGKPVIKKKSILSFLMNL